jgi:hypothetical protein
VFPSDSRKMRPERRARRRTTLAAPERLESRELMTVNSLGFSLPDLTITGSAGSRAAWGGTLGVIATVVNQGSSTITNPIAQSPGSSTTADAPASTVAVVITPHKAMRHEVTIGTFQAPPVAQNSLEQIQETFTLPARPPGFHAGGTFYVHLIVNSTSSVLEADRSNNFSQPIPVQVVSRALPELVATRLSVPPYMQPGDTIQPTISVSNLGTAATSGTVQVALVASTTKSFTIGSSIVALYNITNSIPSASEVATGGLISAFSETVNPLNNTITFTGPSVTLPTSPRKYFLGVVVDPNGQIQQLSSSKDLSQIQVVGPPVSHLPPAGVVSTANSNLFPLPASGVFIGTNPTTTTNSSTIS